MLFIAFVNYFKLDLTTLALFLNYINWLILTALSQPFHIKANSFTLQSTMLTLNYTIYWHSKSASVLIVPVNVSLKKLLPVVTFLGIAKIQTTKHSRVHVWTLSVPFAVLKGITI